MPYGKPKKDGTGRGVRANQGRNPVCNPPLNMRPLDSIGVTRRWGIR